jgi:hypothetical protein
VAALFLHIAAWKACAVLDFPERHFAAEDHQCAGLERADDQLGIAG